MARPQKSTRDTWLDAFSDFPVDVQEGLIDTCQLLHRQAKRREAKPSAAPPPPDAPKGDSASV